MKTIKLIGKEIATGEIFTTVVKEVNEEEFAATLRFYKLKKFGKGRYVSRVKGDFYTLEVM